MARKGATADDSSKVCYLILAKRVGFSVKLSLAHSYGDLFQFNSTKFSALFKYFATHALLIVPDGRSFSYEKAYG